MSRRPPLAVGSTAVRRDVFNGRVWTQGPTRVLRVGADSVTTALWAGVRTKASNTLIASRESGDREAARLRYLKSLVTGEFELGDWVWRRNSFVTDVVDDRWFTVTRIFGEGGDFACWYVNFERPPVWRGADDGVAGWDTLDLVLDLVVEPGGGWSWKDEDEYAHCRRLGLVSESEHVAVGRAREQAVALVEAGSGVFAEDPRRTWLPDPAWPRPEMR
jgi:hypothetical protein